MKNILITAAVMGALAVLLGAFGAHALKAKLTQQALETWHTGVQYHFYHTLALLLLAVISAQSGISLRFSATCFSAGIVLFSGSLYLLSVRELLGAPWLRFVGPVTPVGGLLFIAGWLHLALAAFRIK